jgi:seryl-tRNA synthetase
MDLKVLLSNPEKVKKSQFVRTGKEDTDVDFIISSYDRYKVLLFDTEQKRKLRNTVSKEIGNRKKKGEKEEKIELKCSELKYFELTQDKELSTFELAELLKFSKGLGDYITNKELECSEIKKNIDAKLINIGNIVHESVPVSMNEDDNEIVRVVGACLPKDGLQHPDIMAKLGMDTSEHVSQIAGNRAYYLKGDMFLLQQAVVQYALQFLIRKGYDPIYTPFFMRGHAMDKVCQLSDFDESLYNLKSSDPATKDRDKEYLIATSEQPICAYYINQNLDSKNLPIKHAGFSTCFRKEAGSCGKDTLGIFRVHQFEKIEQFCITHGDNHNGDSSESWLLMEEMLRTSEEFYQSLGIEYRVINIVSGALNNAAAKKYDLEGWFPCSKSFRELVSCSNCTDYQSRNVECLVGQVDNSGDTKVKNYAHMLNATLCAVTRTMCCICETHQMENGEGVRVPAVLIPFVGKEFLLKK